MKFGQVQAGIRLNASCTPFDVVPGPLFERFKTAVLNMAKDWGLSVHFGQDDGSIAQAQQRFWEMQNAHARAAQAGNE